MILYVHETENDQYFIVCGLLLESEAVAEEIYKRFKHRIKDFKLSNKNKKIICLEYKSTILDIHFQRIKIKMLETINEYENSVLYSVYIKKTFHLDDKIKTNIYIKILDRIISSLGFQVDIIFDVFGNPKKENKIIIELTKNKNVNSINGKDSQQNHGIQLVDNICSVVRLKITNKDIYNYYSIIEKNIKKVVYTF